MGVLSGFCGEGFSYKAFINEGGSYPAYGVLHRGVECVVTAVHPGDDENPAKFTSAGGRVFDGGQGKLYEQKGTRVYIYGAGEMPEAVPYDPEFGLEGGTRLVAVSPAGVQVEGSLLYNPANGSGYSSGMGALKLMVITEDETMEGIAQPGWPVFSNETGKVVGTVVARRSVIKPYDPVSLPGRFLFEPLCLPTGSVAEPEMMVSYCGLDFAQPMDRAEFRWMLPDCLWDLEPGMTRATLEDKRGKLSNVREDFNDHSYIIREDTPTCYRVQYVPGREKEDRERIVEIELEGYAGFSVGEYPKAESLVTVLEKAFGKPRMFTTSFDPKTYGGGKYVAHWLCGEKSVTLLMTKGSTEIGVKLVLGEGKMNGLFKRIYEKDKMGRAPGSMVVAYHEWVGSE